MTTNIPNPLAFALVAIADVASLINLGRVIAGCFL